MADGRDDRDRRLDEGPGGPGEKARERELDELRPEADMGRVATGGPGTTPLPPVRARRGLPRNTVLVLAFLGPAMLFIGAFVLYPIVWTVVRSTYDSSGDNFVGLDNYGAMFDNNRTLTAIRNNAIWVVVGPTLATGLGLIYAVLSERIRWQTAFKVTIFMPMAISGLATGVIFRIVYDHDPDLGVLNAAMVTVTDVVSGGSDYEGARAASDILVAEGDGYITQPTFGLGDTVNLGLVAILPSEVPDSAEVASPPSVGGDQLGGVVWLDFTQGGGGERGVVDEAEQGLPGVRVEAVQGGATAASTSTADDGSYVFDDLPPGEYQVRLAPGNFTAAFSGVEWLGPSLVTPSIIAAWLWIWIGFAMVTIGAGLAALPRDVLEAARVDGASEWQVFRKVTAPLLMPVLLVVFVTLVINVLKIFDLVLVMAPGAVQDEANVIALEMWRVSFGGARDPGLGSALAVLLFLLVLPAMAFNIKRLRSGG